MRNTWFLIAATAVAAGLLAFAVARRQVCSMGPGGPNGVCPPRPPRPSGVCPPGGGPPGGAGGELDRLADTSFLARELKLSSAQVAEVAQLHARLGQQLGDCCARHCAARARLAKAIADEPAGGESVETVLADMCSAYEQSERATVDHVRRLRALLDSEQRRRFDELFSRCTCADGRCRASPSEAGPGK